MADKNIGMLPLVPQLDDESLLVVEQQGTAMKMTGRQFKDFGRQSVVEEVQGYVDEAQEAAEAAVSAVKAVTDMTVDASTLDSGEPATVRKTFQSGVYHLAFGLPMGKQGVPGPEGKRGPQGPPGTGLKILGYYDTAAALEAAQPNPAPGDAYGVGMEAPYDVYVFDGESGQWKNNGPLTGGGSIVPENVVTAAGGAALEFGGELGEAPHVVSFDDEEEPPLTAEDVQYSDTKTVKEAIDGLFTSVSNGKQAVASAITDMGVPTAQDAAFSEMAENIRQISAGSDTSDATATPGDILSGKTAYTAAGKVEGIIPTLPAQTIIPGTANKTIAGGQYLGGTQTIQGDTNLVSANIRQGVSIFGVAGAMTSQFQATLTVKADVGAVVTAKCGDTEVSALSTNGSVVLELPIEGAWTVTAVRGVAQYNSVVVNVSSHYSAELTAEVHIEYFGTAMSLSRARVQLAGGANERYAIFCGGKTSSGTSSDVSYIPNTDAYDQYLVRTKIEDALPFVSLYGTVSAAAAVGEFLVFYNRGYACAYDNELVRVSVKTPSIYKANDLAAASVGGYALFGGGLSNGEVINTVDAYDSTLTRQAPIVLAQPVSSLAAGGNQNYAIFGGGSKTATVTAYNSSLTRSIPTSLSEARSNLSGARAGNYVVFAGDAASKAVDAYDLFLTRSLPEQFSAQRGDYAGTTIGGHAIFSGGHIRYNANNSDYFANTDVFDPYLVHTVPTQLSQPKYYHAAAAIGGYALFAGGYDVTTSGYSNLSDTVKAYKYI